VWRLGMNLSHGTSGRRSPASRTAAVCMDMQLQATSNGMATQPKTALHIARNPREPGSAYDPVPICQLIVQEAWWIGAQDRAQKQAYKDSRQLPFVIKFRS
jgi:hypothetical protein